MSSILSVLVLISCVLTSTMAFTHEDVDRLAGLMHEWLTPEEMKDIMANGIDQSEPIKSSASSPADCSPKSILKESLAAEDFGRIEEKLIEKFKGQVKSSETKKDKELIDQFLELCKTFYPSKAADDNDEVYHIHAAYLLSAKSNLGGNDTDGMFFKRLSEAALPYVPMYLFLDELKVNEKAGESLSKDCYLYGRISFLLRAGVLDRVKEKLFGNNNAKL